MDEERRARKNAYMKEYLKRWRRTDRGREIQKQIKKRQNQKNKILHNLTKLAEVAREYVRHHAHP